MTRDHKRRWQSDRDHGRVRAIQTMLCARIDSLLPALQVGLSRSGRFYQGRCPVHGGDNSQALTLYHTGDTSPGYWRCYSRHCHDVFRPTIVGFVRGVLSHHKHGWAAKGDKTVSFGETIRWCCEFLGERFEDIEVDDAELERMRFAGQVASFIKKPTVNGKGLRREQVRARLTMPAEYFVKRGWSKEVLDRYDVGFCQDPNKPFYNRVVVPIYDDENRWVVGFTARSVLPQCEKCGLWHEPGGACPQSQQERAACCKWRNSNFNREGCLYNWWFAQGHIQKTGVVCLVEGPGEVWRLEEAGVHCGLALLSNSLTDEQQVRLETSGAMTVISLLNSDEAGKAGAGELRSKLGRCYRLVFPTFEKNDLGDMSVEEVKQLVLPLVEKHRRKF